MGSVAEKREIDSMQESLTLMRAVYLLFLPILVFGCARQDVPAQVTPLPIAARGVPGPFDGTWQVEAPEVWAGPGVVCGLIDLRFEIRDSRIVGGLKRTPYSATVVSSEGFSSAPMNGTVQPDGAVDIGWEEYVVTGQVTGDSIRLQWKGECGPRVATGLRVTAESNGSSTGRR